MGKEEWGGRSTRWGTGRQVASNLPFLLIYTKPHSPRKDEQLIQEDLRAKFYTAYRKAAEEYDKEFIKRHNEDLNTILILVRLEGDTANIR